GRAAHLAGMYEESNRLLNEADQIAEDPYKSIGEKLKGTVLNPMKQTYTGEPFERFMLHYYKALNYFYLGNIEEAVVEAIRITLATYDQQDITKDNDNRYSKDAFSHILQGLIYEKSGDINNAFIAYRNAAETYLNAPGKKWYGVPIPEQLQMDLLR